MRYLLLISVIVGDIAFSSASVFDMLHPNTACSTTSGAALYGAVLGLCQDAERQNTVAEPIHVFVAGLSKTGTSSVHDALEELGYKTYHGKDIGNSQGHLDMWYDVSMTGNVTKVFETLAREGYNATTDLPTAGLYREALERYPEARFVLTVRDSAERWAAKWNMHGKVMGVVLGGIFQWFEKFRKIKDILWWIPTQLPALAPGECLLHSYDVAKCTRVYKDYNADVIAAIPQHQLLIFNVKQGYQPLCEFLDVPQEACPATFPHANEAIEGMVLYAVGLLVRYGWWMPLLLLCYSILSRHRGTKVKAKAQ